MPKCIASPSHLSATALPVSSKLTYYSRALRRSLKVESFIHENLLWFLKFNLLIGIHTHQLSRAAREDPSRLGMGRVKTRPEGVLPNPTLSNFLEGPIQPLVIFSQFIGTKPHIKLKYIWFSKKIWTQSEPKAKIP